MKNFIILFFSIITFSSCYKYEEPTLVSLSGEYVVDKVTVINTEDTNQFYQEVFLPGDTYINQNSEFPLSVIDCGFTRWHFDYSVISFCPYPNSDGSVTYTEQFFYNYEYPLTSYEYGYVNINLISRRLILKLIDDQPESLTFRTTGQWTFNNIPKEVSITIQLTRIGP